MRLPASSCLLCRHSVLLRTLNSQRVAFIPSQPASSLSAIHNGLRQSQKSRPQGFNRSSLEAAGSHRPSQGSHRSRDPDWTPPTFKIKRGKKDVTDTGPGRQSRRSRFNDPTSSFGKRSLVYQMKHGALRAKMAELGGQERGNKAPSSPRSSPDRMTPGDFMRDFKASTGGQTNSTRNDRGGRAFPAYDRRPEGRAPRARPVSDTRSFDNERMRRTNILPSEPRREERMRRTNILPSEPRREERMRRTNILPSEPRREERTSATPSRTRHEFSSNKPEQLTGTRTTDDGPIRIHHTTAASQFLYGRSVVEAALKDSRRQFYKLYIYSGDDRRNVSQDDVLTKLAQKKGVDVTKVPNDGLRMMDKMSGGRPHNGCVLEASPLPQLPLKALGPLSEDPKNPGFHVEVAHQSSEEAKVNGTSNFVSYQLPKGRKPFVLVLDGILDPGNLGAILRTAAFLGVNGIAITKGSSATLTAVALKASAGASEVATLFSVNSAADFLTRSKENGWLVYTAVPSTKRSKGNSHLTVDRVETYDPLSSQPTVLVVGSEGEGLTKQVRRQGDHEVSIPSPAGGLLKVVDSLNVSVATGILCSAFLKKQSSGMIEIEEDPSESDDGSQSQLW
ncbi:RNA methyltransferase [Xylaria sp. FL1042]|nr:RNA methyltransferase [Xylaria sp. FL1042]